MDSLFVFRGVSRVCRAFLHWSDSCFISWQFKEKLEYLRIFQRKYGSQIDAWMKTRRKSENGKSVFNFCILTTILRQSITVVFIFLNRIVANFTFFYTKIRRFISFPLFSHILRCNVYFLVLYCFIISNRWVFFCFLLSSALCKTCLD